MGPYDSKIIDKDHARQMLTLLDSPKQLQTFQTYMHPFIK